jgi:hypothetical protein
MRTTSLKPGRNISEIGNLLKIEKESGTIEKNVLFEEDIGELIEIIFNQRIERGEYGTVENNWLMADDRTRAEEYIRLRHNSKSSASKKRLLK